MTVGCSAVVWTSSGERRWRAVVSLLVMAVCAGTRLDVWCAPMAGRGSMRRSDRGMNLAGTGLNCYECGWRELLMVGWNGEVAGGLQLRW
ncbi:oxidoreductase [Sesbania bispinosa]|nr:oxidoreductase [Sesbania bispinosa]